MSNIASIVSLARLMATPTPLDLVRYWLSGSWPDRDFSADAADAQTFEGYTLDGASSFWSIGHSLCMAIKKEEPHLSAFTIYEIRINDSNQVQFSDCTFEEPCDEAKKCPLAPRTYISCETRSDEAHGGS